VDECKPLLAELIKLITSALLLSRQIAADPKAERC
jgi:hypothetical protein